MLKAHQDNTMATTTSTEVESCSVYIIDDMATGRHMLTSLIQNVDPDIEVHAFDNAEIALPMAEMKVPDLVITDFRMPDMDGAEFIRTFRSIAGCDEVPIIVVTASEDKNVRYESLEAGATDFLTRPLDPNESIQRCRNLLKLRYQQKILHNRARDLEQKVADATREILEREKETLFRLARAGEYRDEDTGNHVLRIAQYCRAIAEAMNLSEEECTSIEMAAPMHDVGKIGITDTVLLKAGKLEADEWEIMKTHTTIGYDILKGSPSSYLKLGAEIALCHHEKWDGNGYPAGLSGKKIPLAARIVAVADVYDALRSRRPYKQPWPVEEVFAYIEKETGRHFCPDCAKTFLDIADTIKEIEDRFSD